MEINGVELEFNIYEYETAKKYEEAVQILSAAKHDTSLSYAATIKEQCRFASDFIDKIFGAGTAAQIFDGKLDMKLYTEAVRSIVEEFAAQKSVMDELVGKYAPKRAAK